MAKVIMTAKDIANVVLYECYSYDKISKENFDDIFKGLNEMIQHEKKKMTRKEAIACFKKHMPLALNASDIIQFYIEAGMLEIVEEEEKYIDVKVPLLNQTVTLKVSDIKEALAKNNC